MDEWVHGCKCCKCCKYVKRLECYASLMLYAFVMVGVSNTYLNWHGHTGGKFACFLACALTFWLLQLLSGLLLAYAPTFWLLQLLSGLLAGHAPTFWLLQLLSGLPAGLRNCVLACATVSWPAQLCLCLRNCAILWVSA